MFEKIKLPAGKSLTALPDALMMAQLVRPDLTLEEQDYYRQLRREMDEILAGRTESELIAEANVEILQRYLKVKKALVDLIVDRKKQMEKKEIGSDLEEIDLTDYGAWDYCFDDAGTMYVRASKQDKELGNPDHLVFDPDSDYDRNCVFNEKGEKIGGDFTHVGGVFRYGERAFIPVDRLGMRANMNIDGTIIGGWFPKKTVMEKAGEKFFFCAQKKDGKWAVFDDTGQQVSADYLSIKDNRTVGDHYYCQALTNELPTSNWVVLKDGKPIGQIWEKINLIIVEDKIFFGVNSGSVKKALIDGNGQEITDKFHYNRNFELGKVKMSDGRVFLTVEDSIGRPMIIDEKGKPLFDKKFFEIKNLFEYQGQLYFHACLEPGKWGIYDRTGQAITNRIYDGIVKGSDGGFPFLGKIKKTQVSLSIAHGFSVDHDREKQVLISERGEHIGGEFDSLSDAVKVGDRFYFSGKRKKKFRLSEMVFDNQGKQIGGEYKKIEFLRNFGDRMFYEAIKHDGTRVLCNEQGQELITGVDSCFFYGDNGKTYVMCYCGKILRVIDQNGHIVGNEEYLAEGSGVFENGLFCFFTRKKDKKLVIVTISNGKKIEISCDKYQKVSPFIINGRVFFHGKEKGKNTWSVYDQNQMFIIGGFNEIIEVKNLPGGYYVIGVRDTMVVKERIKTE